MHSFRSFFKLERSGTFLQPFIYSSSRFSNFEIAEASLTLDPNDNRFKLTSFFNGPSVVMLLFSQFNSSKFISSSIGRERMVTEEQWSTFNFFKNLAEMVEKLFPIMRNTKIVEFLRFDHVFESFYQQSKNLSFWSN